MPGLSCTSPRGRQGPSSLSRRTSVRAGPSPKLHTPTRPVTAAGPEEDDQCARRRPNYA
jgi:hypothetical protein